MPNWVACELQISIDEVTNKNVSSTKLKEFVKFAKTTKEGKKNCLTTEKFIPYPKRFRDKDKFYKNWWNKANKFAKEHNLKNYYEVAKDLKEQFVKENGKSPKDGFNDGGYSWCCRNWGTKWGICNAQLIAKSYKSSWNYIKYAFDTAWSPPIPLIKKMSDLFPELHFELRYFEGGMGFNGILICVGGTIKEDEQGKYYGYRGG